jgi:hypothetical protein
MPVKTSNVRTVSPGGQISLGKKYAGRQVIIDEVAEGVWTVKTAITIPENELWLHQEPFKSRLDAAIRRAEERMAKGIDPEETDLDEFEAKIMARIEQRR